MTHNVMVATTPIPSLGILVGDQLVLESDGRFALVRMFEAGPAAELLAAFGAGALKPRGALALSAPTSDTVGGCRVERRAGPLALLGDYVDSRTRAREPAARPTTPMRIRVERESQRGAP